MTDKKARERIVWIYLLVSNTISTAFSLADPPQKMGRVLFHLVLPIILVAISAWQLLANQRR